MAGTANRRDGGSFEIFGAGRASGACQQSAGRTDRRFLYGRRHLKVYMRKILMDPAHNLFPQCFVERFAVIFQKFVGVITCPYRAGIIWGKSCKPHITGCRGCTCLTGYRHIVKLQSVTGTAFVIDNTLESACQQICGALTEHFGCLRLVFQNHIPVLIEDFGVKYRFGVSAAVCDRRIGSGQFQGGDTIGDTAKCRRFPRVIIYLTVDDFMIGNLIKAKFFQIRVAKSWCDVTETLHGDGVTGIFEGIADRHCTAITAVGIFDRSVGIFISDRLVYIGICQRKSQIVDRRSVNSQRFEGRTRLPVGVGCTVQRQTGGFFPAAADESFDITGVLVDDHHGRLRLCSKADPFGNDSFAFAYDSCFVLIYIILCFLFRVKQQVEIFVSVIFKVQFHHFFTVVLCGSIRFLHR